VALLPGACCGRAAISTGLLSRARRIVEQTAPILDGAIERWQPAAILVCEPSCLSSITDDWPSLKTTVSTDVKARIANRCTLPETFINQHWSAHTHMPDWRSTDGQIVLHGHCHQKALWGTADPVELLGRIAGPQNVTCPDTGCCGMAGAVGMAAHRYNLSMRIGADRLFPIVNSLAAQDSIIAPVTICRHQILEGTGRTALHPISWLRSHLPGPDD
jgi:Fe-S oxidoreductase